MTNEDKASGPDSQVTPPPWLDVNFIQNVLRNDGDEQCQVERVTCSAATGAGENYCSTMFRVRASLSDGRERCVLVKGPPPGAEMAAYVRQFQMFQREGEMLAHVVPQMQALLEKASHEKLPPLAPRCLLHRKGPEECVVMEDLSPGGFRVADRKRGLGLRHALLALRSLARFHAASHAVLRRRPELLQTLDNSWRKAEDSMRCYVELGLQAAADVCRTWPGYEEYADALERAKKTIVEKLVVLNDPTSGGFDVIGHGDFWTTNMMFRYEDGQPCDYRLIDLQLCHVTSPALDVLHLLHTSLSEDVSTHHEDLLLREYHVALEETSTLLGIKAPSLAEFLADAQARGTFTLYGAFCETPVMRAETAADIDACLTGDGAANAHMYRTPRMRAWFQRVLPKLRRRGLLDA